VPGSQRHDGALRLYRRLLRLYPAPFREEYEREMLGLVEDARAHASGPRARLALWARILADLCSTAPSEHLSMLKEDVRHAARALRRSPALAACVLLVFAVGTGATTAIFTLANAVLLRPLPFDEPDRLVLLDESAPTRDIASMGTTFPNLLDYQRQSRSFTGIGAFFASGFTVSGGAGDPERVDGAYVSWNLFDVLGVHPALGRAFLEEEDRSNVDTAVILGHGLWQRRFGADPGVLGRTVLVGGRSRLVVGIMPPGFRFPEAGEVWVPMSLDAAANTRTDNFLTAIARLAPGVSLEQASADMDAIMADIARRHPAAASEIVVNVRPLRDTLTADYQSVLVRLLVAGLFVLAIACTNVANLLLARAAGRRRELALRATLGANRRRIVRQLLTETLLLAALGGLAGAILGASIVPAILRSAPIDIPYWISLDPDWRVLAFSMLVITLAGLAAGVGPALQATRLDLVGVLTEGAKGAGLGQRVRRLREGLVALQIALSVVLLVGAGLMVRSFVNLAQADLGFRADDVLTFRLALPQARYPERPARAQFYGRAIGELSALPQVERVGAASAAPFGGTWWRTFLAEGETKSRLSELPPVLNVVVTPGYFAAMGISLDRGRDFTADDGPARPVVIVNRTIANRYWPGQDPVGRQVRIDSFLPDSPWRTVVGVAGDVRWSNPREEAPPTVYVPHAFEPLSSMTVVVRARTPVPTLAADVRTVIRRLDPELAVASVRPVAALVERANWSFRFYTQLFVVFAVIAVLLAAVGLSGMLALMVADRTHEIGIRLAIGAAPGTIVGMVVGRALVLAIVGIGAGALGAVALTRTLHGLLYGVTAQDWPTFAAALLMLLAVALIAGLIPARRAARVSPLVALKAD
jgi:predicted permease